MPSNLNNAFLFLIDTLMRLYMTAVLLRIVLQLVRADFHNPLSQFVWRATNPVVHPLTRFVKRIGPFDTAAAIILLLLALINVTILFAFNGVPPNPIQVVFYSFHTLVLLILNFFVFTLIVGALISWFNPGVHNPISSMLWAINEPILRPIRQILPPMSGLDLSPLIALLAIQFIKILIG